MLKKKLKAPPIEELADEPVLFRTGPHWIANDITIGLAILTVVSLVLTFTVDRSWLRFAAIPMVPLMLRLLVDVPRYWHFGVVLTSRRLVVDVGIVRDVFHTLRLSHVRSVTMRQNPLGALLGFGEVEVVLDAVDGNGKRHHGTYAMSYVRRPKELRDAILDAAYHAGGMSEDEAYSLASKSSEAEFTQ